MLNHDSLPAFHIDTGAIVAAIIENEKLRTIRAKHVAAMAEEQARPTPDPDALDGFADMIDALDEAIAGGKPEWERLGWALRALQ